MHSLVALIPFLRYSKTSSLLWLVAQIDQTTKDNVEIANESAIISSTVSDIANNILEDVKKKRF
ncbi:hypothetical protein RC04_01050 [Campylobacter jejuni]|nr:hypothetical protein [Campylobacter jejuni]ALW07384.1 hypothetical protein RC04_01050 [Campylobacter jejuni]